MKTDIRRYLATDVAARRLKLDTETGTTQSSVLTDNQQDPFRKSWQTKSGAQLRQKVSPSRKIRRKVMGDPRKQK